MQAAGLLKAQKRELVEAQQQLRQKVRVRTRTMYLHILPM